MTIRTTGLTLVLLSAFATAPAIADHEGPGAHAKHDTHTITIDGNDVRPSTTTMSHGDVVAFENYSTQPARVTFTEPKDLKDKIRCGLVKGSEKDAPSAPWALFTWENDKLVGNVPPGQFASVCALEPGAYSFTTTLVGVGSASGSAKGQIVVK